MTKFNPNTIIPEIITEINKIEGDNTKAINELNILLKNIVFCAPEILDKNFWYGNNFNYYGLYHIMVNNFSGKGYKNLSDLYNNICIKYKNHGFIN